MWTCLKCGERIDDEFEVCWACGTTQDGVEDPTFRKADADPVPIVETGITERLPLPDELMAVATYYDSTEAHQVRARLEAEGIRVFLADENSMALNFMSSAIGGIKLLVPVRDAGRASLILADLEDEDEDRNDPDDEYA